MSSEKTNEQATAYNLIYYEAKTIAPEFEEKPRRSSGDAIKAKLIEAEERRKTLEMDKISGCAEMIKRVEFAHHKKQELNKSLCSDIEKKISEKSTVGEENYNKQIMIRQEKIKKHIDHINDVYDGQQLQRTILKERISTNLNNSQTNREIQIAMKKDKLIDHEVLSDRRDSLKENEIKLAAKMNNNAKNRDQIIMEKTSKLKQHGEYVNKVRKMKQMNIENSSP